MKDTVILLIFLLAVVGLVIGVYYTEVDNIEKTSKDHEKLYEDSNGVITITLEEIERNDSFIDPYLT
jgi:uncharacterized membrane protein